MQPVIKYNKDEETVVNKDWAAGSSKQHEHDEFVLKCVSDVWSAEYTTVTYAPAWYKSIDEIIVNAVDQFIKNLHTGTPVTIIKVEFVRETGRIRVYNNGRGIDTSIHEEASAIHHKTIHTPTLVFGYIGQGEHRVKLPDSITGGTNGIGGKLGNCYSTEFAVRTVHDRVHFTHKWTDHMKNELGAVIHNVSAIKNLPADQKCEHTLVSFILDYCGDKTRDTDIEFYKTGFGYTKYDDTVYDSLVDIVRTRVVLALTYCRYTLALYKKPPQPPIAISFNDKELTFSSLVDVAELFFPDDTATRIILTPVVSVNPLYKYPWEVVLVVTNTSKLKQKRLSIVNGVVCDGTHLDYLYNILCTAIINRVHTVTKDKTLKITSLNVSSCIFMFVNAKIPQDGIAWTGQRKDVLTVPAKKLTGYTFDTKTINTITSQVQQHILSQALDKKPKRKQINYDKYRGADKAGTAKSSMCSLIAAEGDSAMNQIISGLGATDPVTSHRLGFEHYGVISTGGVILNAKKQVTKYDTPGGVKYNFGPKLRDNLFINALISALGLSYSHRYIANAPNYKKQVSELRYGCLIVAPDQDLDGKGKILGLIMTLFQTFWPALYDAGFIKWFQSDIIRLYPKCGRGKVICEYSESSYQRKTLPSINVRDYDVQYCKGWSTNSEEEVNVMMSQISARLFTFYYDDRSDDLFEVYFGKDSNPRKVELSKPLTPIDDVVSDLQLSTRKISCSHHLEGPVREFQANDLEQKLIHVMDGLNQSSRKILAGILMHFARKNKPIAVARLGGFVSNTVGYDHGEDSLHDSIIRKGLITVGGMQLPCIVPLSNFGTRLGDDAGKPRYVKCKLNSRLTSLLYPSADYYLLEFNVDDGKRTEPKWFLPIIPMAGLESVKTPSHGWTLNVWARDVFAVINAVRKCIFNNEVKFMSDLPPCSYAGSPYEWTGTFTTTSTGTASSGRYNIIDQTHIRITELPLRVWTTKYVSVLKTKMLNGDIIEDVANNSDGNRVDIVCELKPDGMARIEALSGNPYIDCVEQYFELKKNMVSNLNMIGASHQVLTLDRYCDVFTHWFPARKLLYQQRLERECVMFQLKIMMRENIIRYIKDPNKITSGKEANMCAYLEQHQYMKLAQSVVDTPKFIPTRDLVSIATTSDADYKYLLSLSDLKKSDEHLHKCEVELDQLKKTLAAYKLDMSSGSFIGSRCWLRELDELEKIVIEGFKTKWQFGDNKKFIL